MIMTFNNNNNKLLRSVGDEDNKHSNSIRQFKFTQEA